MITYVKGDLFSSPAQIIVNTVNTVGVMGKGVALEFKKRYPEMFVEYQKLCKEKKLDIGKLFLWRKSDKWVLLFPTKKHWRNPSQLEYIEKGLMKFSQNWDKMNANSVAFPRLGCGNGGLNWSDVKPLMEKYLNNLPMQVYVYVDNYKDPIPEHKSISEIEQWLAGEKGVSGYEAFRIKLRNLILDDKDSDTTIQFRDDMVCIDDVRLEDSQVCDIWNLVRDTGIISPIELPYEFRSISDAFMELMVRLNYVSRVIVSSDGINFDKKSNAYQYIAD